MHSIRFLSETSHIILVLLDDGQFFELDTYTANLTNNILPNLGNFGSFLCVPKPETIILSVGEGLVFKCFAKKNSIS